MKKIIYLYLLCVISLFSKEFTYPTGKLYDSVKLGEDILLHTDTNKLSKDFVGSKLQCVNCHRKGENGKVGTIDKIGTFIGTATAFPAYSKRHKSVISLQKRIEGCFQRCLNGDKKVVGTKVGIAVASYITWLSNGMDINMSSTAPRTPLKQEFWSENVKKFTKLFKKATHKDYVEGEKLYLQKCASCHGINGDGNDVFPPLWGKDKDGKWLSYTADGSMAKLSHGATWIQDNMPLNFKEKLGDKEAMQITLYINAQPREPYKDFTIEKNFEKLGLDLKKIIGK